MLGLSTLGLIHTAISLVALAAGLILIVRDGVISPRARFGPPHALAILTLAALAAGWAASYTGTFGPASRYVEAVCYSATFLFHLVPGFTETLTRLPAGAPIASSDQAPILQGIDSALLVLFLAWLTWQVLKLRARPR